MSTDMELLNLKAEHKNLRESYERLRCTTNESGTTGMIKYRLIEYKKSLDELERIMLALESAINDTGDDNI